MPLDELADAIPDVQASRQSAASSGALENLQRWWQDRSDGATPMVAWMSAPEAGAHADSGWDLGIAAAAAAAADGATVIVPVADDDPQADETARAIIAVLSNRDASTVCHQWPGRPDTEWMLECAHVRDLGAGLARHRGDPQELLAEADPARIGYMAGLLFGAALHAVPCLLDGTSVLAAALVADRIGYRAKAWWGWASTSVDPACAVAAERMLLDPLLDLRVASGPQAGRRGMGAKAALALIEIAIAPAD